MEVDVLEVGLDVLASSGVRVELFNVPSQLVFEGHSMYSFRVCLDGVPFFVVMEFLREG